MACRPHYRSLGTVGSTAMVTKRLMDIGLGSVMTVVAVPVILVLSLWSVVAFRAWPLFVQERVGRRGRRFRCPKIRTLPTSFPPYAPKYDIGEVPLSRMAAFVRASHLDELPQLALVPVGVMSLVGPRPEQPQLHEEFDRDFARARTAVRPGCAGVWQVCDRSDRLIGETPHHDLFYLRYRSLPLDLWVLWRATRMVVGLRQTASVQDVPPWALRRPTGGAFWERPSMLEKDRSPSDITSVSIEA